MSVSLAIEVAPGCRVLNNIHGGEVGVGISVAYQVVSRHLYSLLGRVQDKYHCFFTKSLENECLGTNDSHSCLSQEERGIVGNWGVAVGLRTTFWFRFSQKWTLRQGFGGR